MATEAGVETFTAVWVLVLSSLLILINLGLLARSRFISHNVQILKGRILILLFSLIQLFLGISLAEGFYNTKTAVKRIDQVAIVLCTFIFLVILAQTLYQYWITAYNLEKLVKFVISAPSTL